MATTSDLLTEAYGRIHDAVHRAVDGLTEDQLTFRADPEANTIAWLVWHLTRVQDDHVAEVAGTEQVWTADGWDERFGLPFGAAETGYGMDPGQIASVKVPAEELTGYFDAVHESTLSYLEGLEDADLDRIVDDNWDPPVTLAVRLVSVVQDDLMHVGQAAYVRGLVERG